MQDPYIAGLDVYMVGGAVRDELLGLPAGDRDWVVVGASPEIMTQRGFIPVGGDFPVFLHPVTHEEYALARTERKSGRGYKGFVFYSGTDVSLEQDLCRRDLTINAIAKDFHGNLFDPCGGVADIKNKVLRHIGIAFTEDPVRLLRLARFAARFDSFTIASETVNLCHKLVASGELDALVPERVWQEFAKGLLTINPARMLNVLQETNALIKVAPELVWSKKYTDTLNKAAALDFDLAQRYALMCFWSAGKVLSAVPASCFKMAHLLPKIVAQIKIIRHDFVPDSFSDAGGIQQFSQRLKVFELADAFRKPDRFMRLMQLAELLTDTGELSVWRQQLDSLKNIDAGAIAKAAAGDVKLIKQNLYLARLQVLADFYQN